MINDLLTTKTIHWPSTSANITWRSSIERPSSESSLRELQSCSDILISNIVCLRPSTASRGQRTIAGSSTVITERREHVLVRDRNQWSVRIADHFRRWIVDWYSLHCIRELGDPSQTWVSKNGVSIGPGQTVERINNVAFLNHSAFRIISFRARLNKFRTMFKGL